MSKGDRITRSAYNTLQTQVAGIMGVGSGQSGYGQNLVSRQANIGEVITSSLLNELRTDMAKAWTHQTNTGVSDTLLIGPPNLKLYQSGDVVTDFVTQYSDFINNATTGILTRRALFNAAQMQPGIALTTATRSTAWGGAAQVQVISTTITVTFGGYTQGSTTISSTDHPRVFFNAGGSIQISAARSGGTASTKNTTWSNMLSGPGVLSFRGTSTTITGTLNSGNILADTTGFFNLTVGAGLTTIMSQPGPAGVYAENDYVIQVRRPANNTLEFVITFRDDDAGDQTGLGPAVDETVDGTLTVTAQTTRPSGSNVDVPAPTASATALA
jgi:hypothetical protein